MEKESAETILARIVRARDELATPDRPGVLAFDGDGTLWSGDVGEDFFRAAVASGRFLPVAVDAMRDVGRAAGLPGFKASGTWSADAPPDSRAATAHDTGVAMAEALFAGYLEHTVAEDVICEVIAWMCAGWREEEVVALAASVVRDFEARRRLELEPILAWARASHVEAFLVSASPRPVVEAAGAAWGFDRAHVLATTASFVGGILQPIVERPIPYGPGKTAQLVARIGDRPLLAAFGDNVFDVPMLEAARVPVAVEPKPRLLARLAEMPSFAPVRLQCR